MADVKGSSLTVVTLESTSVTTARQHLRVDLALCDCNRRPAVLVSMLQCAALMQSLLHIVHMAGRGYVASQWLLFLAS